MEETIKTYIVDASFILKFLLPDEADDLFDEYFIQFQKKECNFITSTLLSFEVGNALKSAVVRSRISQDSAYILYNSFLQLAIETVECDYNKVLSIALEKNLSFYDASYIYLAQKYKASLLTLDKRLLSL